MKYLLNIGEQYRLRHVTDAIFRSFNIDLTQSKFYKINNHVFRGLTAELDENEMIYLVIKTRVIVIDQNNPTLKVSVTPNASSQRRIQWEALNK